MNREGLTGHVVDLSALVSLSNGTSAYVREVMRQCVVYSITLLVPASAAQYLGTFHAKAGRLLDVSVLLVAPLSGKDVTAAIGIANAMDTNAQLHPARMEEPTLQVLVAAHAAHLARARGWRLMTSTPHLYDGIDDVRVEILP